jgi:hypothetical protein
VRRSQGRKRADPVTRSSGRIAWRYRRDGTTALRVSARQARALPRIRAPAARCPDDRVARKAISRAGVVAHVRLVANSIVRSEEVERTKAMVDGCVLSARCGSRARVAETLVLA